MPLKLIKLATSANFYIRGTVRKVKVFETSGTTDREAAEAIRARREWEILQGSVFGTKAVTSTLTDACIIYLENGGEARFTKALTDYFAETPIAQIDQNAVDVAGRAIYPGVGPATLLRQVYTPITAIINAGAVGGLCSPIKLKRPKQPKSRVRWITHGEADALIKACAPHLYPLVAFLLYTGARISEALWIDWRFIDLDRAQVQFLDTKNGKDRGVPLHPALVAILANLRHRDGEVFRRADGLPYEPPTNEESDRKNSGGDRIKKGFAGACKRAGITDFTPHDCRHTWATWHYMQHRDPNGLMHLGGWSSLAMVMRYAHVNVEHVLPQIAAMPTIGAPASPATRQAELSTFAAQAIEAGQAGG